MLHVFRLLLLLINIDQETVLNWFGIEDLTNQKIPQSLESDSDLTFLNIHSSSDVSLETFRLIYKFFFTFSSNTLHSRRNVFCGRHRLCSQKERIQGVTRSAN